MLKEGLVPGLRQTIRPLEKWVTVLKGTRGIQWIFNTSQSIRPRALRWVLQLWETRSVKRSETPTPRHWTESPRSWLAERFSRAEALG